MITASEDARGVRLEGELSRRGISLRGRGSERCGPCPVCGGTDRFSINLKKQLWNCRGCEIGGDVIALVEHLDGCGFMEAVEMLAGTTPAPAAAMERPSYDPRAAFEWAYQDESSSPLFRSVRTPEKRFWQSPADGNGGWVKPAKGCMDGVRLVPLYLPEVLAAIRNSGSILIAEGERKVDLLRHWGFVATCNVSGAIRSKLWFDHAKEFFSAGCYAPKIIILPDKDDAGRKHADTIGAAFAAVGITVHILDLPGLRNKEDVINWYDRGGTREQLRDLIERETRPWAPSERESVNPEKPLLREQEALPAPPDRASLLLSAWLARDIPLRDYLLGGVICTTSRWFIWGETGIGKTLIGMDMAAAMAAASNFLRWAGQRRSRVMYLDGELPVETFKERMQLIAARYGSDLQFYGYNRESLGFDGMPPLNTDLGQRWLRRELDAIKPDAIFFDSIMCLLIGSMLEEATWMPMRAFVRELTARRIAQIYFNHANEAGKSFGDKTREWEMDTTPKLSKPEGDEFDETAIKFEFIKARLRTPAIADQFKPMIIYPDNLRFEEVGKGGAPKRTQAEFVAAKFLEAYDRLADGVPKTPGFDGKPVAKVSAKALCEEMNRRGFLEKDEKGNVTSTGRSSFHRAKIELLKDKLQEGDGLIWRP
jgi:hypothetical protein